MEQANRKGIQRVRHEIRTRDVKVARIAPLGESFLAITFQGESLDGFVSASFDDHVKFIFPSAHGAQVRRDYTPLYYDAEARELTLEFALHDSGAASNWAREAAPGQPATIAGPRGSMIIPEEYDWHLLHQEAAAGCAVVLHHDPVPRPVAVTDAALESDRNCHRCLPSNRYCVDERPSNASGTSLFIKPGAPRLPNDSTP